MSRSYASYPPKRLRCVCRDTCFLFTKSTQVRMKFKSVVIPKIVSVTVLYSLKELYFLNEVVFFFTYMRGGITFICLSNSVFL
jgi:hypothetical protein